MRDLAPEITRQRLLVEGRFTAEVDEAWIRRFLDGLASALGLRSYGEATVFAPAGLGREGNQGFDAFLPLIDSGISLYVWSAHGFLSLVLFTCKRFDVDAALAFTRDGFGMTEVEHQEF